MLLDDTTFFTTFVQAQYGVERMTLQPVSGDLAEGRVVYRVGHPDGSAWVLRAWRIDQPVPAWLGAGVAANIPELLSGRAALLARITALEYPAPNREVI